MKTLNFTLLALFIFSLSAFSQSTKHIFENEKGKVEYEKTDGRFNGNYVSYYLNGQKKAEGKFDNNYRTGIWTVWNEKGKVLVTKEYFSPFVTNTADAVSVKEITYKKNEDGVIDYYPFEQKNVVWSKRLWRTIEKENNPELFKEDGLFSIFYMLGINGEIKTYDPNDDEFTTELSVEKLADVDPDKVEIVAYKIKEDVFFDSERQVSETRIIGIMPVAKNKKNGNSVDLFWVYYPEVRKYLGFQPLNSTSLPEKIKSIDDVFFYNCFYGQITKQSNKKDESISDYKKEKSEQLKESERIDLDIINREHEMWIKQ